MTSESHITVLFIAGADRSGTTLLGRLFGGLPGCCDVGELLNIWDHGADRNQLCGCGVPFDQCSFWMRVMTMAGREMAESGVDLAEVRRCNGEIRRCAGLGIEPLRNFASQRSVAAYAAAYTALYRSIADVSGCRVIVDSSKAPAQALLIARYTDLRLCATHVVRDSRGVVYSLSRTRVRPEVHWAQETMTRLTTLQAVKFWVKMNVQCERLRRAEPPVPRISYERFVADPCNEAGPTLDALGIDRVELKSVISGASTKLATVHSVAGNPMRFKTGPIDLVADNEWTTQMATFDFAATTGITAPLLLRYGYHLSLTRQC